MSIFSNKFLLLALLILALLLLTPPTHAAKKKRSTRKEKKIPKKKKKFLTEEEKELALNLRNQGEQLQQAGQMEAATKAYLKAYKIQPILDDAVHQHAYMNNIGWTLHNFNERRAKKFYKKAIKALPNPPFPHTYLNLGDMARQNKKFKDAIRYYKKATKIKPTPSTVAMLGQLHMWSGDLDGAIFEYDKVVKLDPSFQEVHNYYGQAFSLKREWKKASKAFINTVRYGLPPSATDCYRGNWKVMESWESDKGVSVTKLPPPSGYKGKFIEPLSSKVYRDADRKYKLVRVRRVHLEGRSLTRMYQGAPRCVYFTGEHTASGVPPWNWGVADENQPPLSPPKEIQTIDEPVVVLFDRRSGHGNYYHHQTELLARTLWFFRDVYRPREKKWKNVKFLIPPGVLLHLPLFDADELFLHMPAPKDILSWEKNDRFYLKEMYTVGWTPPVDISERGKVGEQEWIKVSEPIFQLHFPPRALLRLTHEAMRTSVHVQEFERYGFGGLRPGMGGSGSAVQPVRIVWYSRSDMEKRHVVGEEKVIRQLRDTFGERSVEVFNGGISFDIARNMNVFGSAHVVVGPHGAGLANLLMCPPGTSLVLLPSCDDLGCPSSADTYFGYLASALGFNMVATKLGPFADFFGNYTVSEGDDQVDGIVDAVEEVLSKRGLWEIGGIQAHSEESVDNMDL